MAGSNASAPPDWTRIEEFVGFGRVDAPGRLRRDGGGPAVADALAEDLAVRSTYAKPVMDLEDAHDGIAGCEHYFDPDRAPRQPTWRVMADLMLRRSGDAEPDGESRRRYRALELGRAKGDTLLCELLPYPSPGTGDWLYAGFGRHRTREDYTTALLPKRIRLLRTVLHSHGRELVVCYGKRNWDDFASLFPGLAWTDHGPFRVADAGATRVVLTTHFSGRGFNTDGQLAALAAVALR